MSSKILASASSVVLSFAFTLALGCSSGGEETGGDGGSSTSPSITTDGGKTAQPTPTTTGTPTPTPTPTAKGALGDNCTASEQCADGKCVQFTDNSGQKRGFCSRQCTKAEDCPESGWECNLAPYTACVPK